MLPLCPQWYSIRYKKGKAKSFLYKGMPDREVIETTAIRYLKRYYKNETTASLYNKTLEKLATRYIYRGNIDRYFLEFPFKKAIPIKEDTYDSEVYYHLDGLFAIIYSGKVKERLANFKKYLIQKKIQKKEEFFKTCICCKKRNVELRLFHQYEFIYNRKRDYFYIFDNHFKFNSDFDEPNKSIYRPICKKCYDKTKRLLKKLQEIEDIRLTIYRINKEIEKCKKSTRQVKCENS